MRPAQLKGWVLDLDGVVVDADRTNARCWKQTFDELLADGGPPFDPVADYRLYVDGRPTSDGIRTFLAARDIELPEGDRDDPPGARSVQGLAARNEQLVERATERRGVHAIAGTVEFLQRLRAAGRHSAVVSSSGDLASTLRAAGVERLFDVVVDDEDARERDLQPKPAPDTLLCAAERLGIAPADCAVLGDGVVDMEAGRSGGFAIVVGLARGPYGDWLRERGADVVVTEPRELHELLGDDAPG